jgi:penicillin amidase
MKIKWKETILIERREGGIPLIHAFNVEDQYYGLGYCHGLDRGMQLMMMKILGTGTASQYLDSSDEMLEVDKFFRRMNWMNNIKDELDKLDPAESALLQAYCSGINNAFSKRKPWELNTLLGYKHFHWTKQDVILLSRMSGYLTLAQSQGEIERLFVQLVQQGVSKQLLTELFAGILGEYDASIISQIQLGEKIIPDAVKWNVAMTPMMASNNWVIGGSKTATGKPILANDPHLEINRLPPVWYEVAIKRNDKYAQGATMPGFPAMIIGRNRKLAWGVTYAFMDASDSWIESCKDGKYFKGGEWHDFKMRKEIINRKKKPPVTITFYENEHGVLDGDPNVKGYYLSTKWSGDRSGAQSVKSGLALDNAEDTSAAMTIAGKIESAFSWVFADVKGNIGFQMSGLMPKRKEGVSGFMPMPGWSSDYDWQGYHDIEDLPREYNPERGYIVTANNDLNHHGKTTPINIPMGTYRADRISQLIEKKENHQVIDSQHMQYDTYSLQAEQFMKVILPLLPDSEAGEILKKWDLSYDTESRGAYLFEMIYRCLFDEVFGKILGKELVDFMQNETGLFIDFYQNFDAILLSRVSSWFRGRDRKVIYQLAIDKGLNTEIKKWGDVNQITMRHIILGGQLPEWLGFDKGPFPLPGGRATIHQGQVYKSAGRQTSFAPSFRIVTDMSEDALYTNFAGGVSDRRFTKWYNNDFSNWASGIFRKSVFK